MANLKKTNVLKLFTVLSPRYFPLLMSKRNIKLQEFHSMQLLRKYQVTVPNFQLFDMSIDEPRLSKLKANEYVVKAQVLAGGRGKGHFDNGFKGGVRLTKNKDEVLKFAKSMLGHNLITKQTSKDGLPVEKVLVSERVPVKRETYFSILLEPIFNGIAVVASSAGGMDIEEVAARTPQLIKSIPIEMSKGISYEIAYVLAGFLKFNGELQQLCAKEITNLWKMFLEIDATVLEINPLVETSDGRVMAIDAKVNCDDNARFRQKDIFDFDDICKTKRNPKEIAAAAQHLVYIDMDGSVGCMVNGAGLAMATMDIIVLHGGRPANFLDLGGGVGPKQVSAALRILDSDPKVKSIFVNVFGGIVNCAIIAKGIIMACKSNPIKLPIIVRLEGTNSKAARILLRQSGLPLYLINDVDQAAKTAIKLAYIEE